MATEIVETIITSDRLYTKTYAVFKGMVSNGDVDITYLRIKQRLWKAFKIKADLDEIKEAINQFKIQKLVTEDGQGHVIPHPKITHQVL